MSATYNNGDTVRLLKIEDAFYRGLDPKDVLALKGLIGEIWTVEGEHAESGTVELVFEYPDGVLSETLLRCIQVPPDWFERV